MVGSPDFKSWCPWFGKWLFSGVVASGARRYQEARFAGSHKKVCPGKEDMPRVGLLVRACATPGQMYDLSQCCKEIAHRNAILLTPFGPLV